MRRLGLLATLALLAACTAPPGASSSPSTPSPSATALPSPSMAPSASASAAQAGSAAADLAMFLEELERTHPQPFHGVDRDAFVAELEAIGSAAEERTPEETMVAVMRLVASLSRSDGRDGHQLAIPTDGGPMLPLRVFEFSDGVFITDALDTGLVGARIVEVAGHPIGEVLDLLEPLVPRDSPATVPGLRPFFLLRADVLQGLGLIGDDASVELSVEQLGETRAVGLDTISGAAYGDFAGPLGIIHLPQRDGLRFTDPSRLFWTEMLDDATLYVRLTEVQPVPPSELVELRDSIEGQGVGRVVLDLRHNPGGDNGTYPMLLGILGDIDVPFWILTDRRTFSAAGNLATELEQGTDARFAGEAMGGGLNFWDDVRFVQLENLPIPMQIGVSTRYWQKSFADDPRLTIDPDLPVEYRSADYFAGRDVGLEAVLAAP